MLEALAAVAPVTAVAGNMDDGKLGKLPQEVAGKVGGVRFIVGHKRKRAAQAPREWQQIEGVGKHDVPDLIVCGHDHLPAVEWVDGTPYASTRAPPARPRLRGRRPERRQHCRERRLAGLYVSFACASRGARTTRVGPG